MNGILPMKAERLPKVNQVEMLELTGKVRP